MLSSAVVVDLKEYWRSTLPTSEKNKENGNCSDFTDAELQLKISYGVKQAIIITTLGDIEPSDDRPDDLRLLLYQALTGNKASASSYCMVVNVDPPHAKRPIPCRS